MKRKEKTNRKLKNKRLEQKLITNNKNENLIVLILSLIPLFFTGFFQGGYFKWEIYCALLLAIPAIFYFVYLKIKNREKIRKSGVDVGLFFYLLVAFVSMFFTVYFHATLTEFYKVLLYITMFYIVLDSVRNEFSFRFVLNSIVVLGSILSIIGLFAFIGYKLNFHGSVFKFMQTNGFIEGYRLASTLQYANTFAAFLILPVLLGISFFISEKKIKVRILYLILLLIMFAALILTQSRGGFIALLLSLVVYFVFLNGRDKKKFLLIMGAAVLIIGLLIFIRGNIFATIISSFRNRMIVLFRFLGGSHTKSLGTRTLMVKDSIKMLRAHPILGTGNGTYQYVYMKYRSAYYFSKFPHSIFFQILDELGIVGGAAFIYLIFALFKNGVRTVRNKYNVLLIGLVSALFGIVLHALMDFDWSLMFMPFIFFVGFAVLFSRSEFKFFDSFAVLKRKNSDEKKTVRRKSEFGERKVRSVTTSTIISVILVFLFLFPFLAGKSDIEGKSLPSSAVNQKELLFNSATGLDPICAEYHFDLAHLYSKELLPRARNVNKIEAYISQAENEYKLAIKYCPEFFLYHYELAQLYLQTNNKQAIDEFEKAVSLNPIDPGGHAALGFAILQLGGDLQLARIQLEEALKLNPKNSDAHLGMGRLYEKMGDKLKAIEEYKTALKYNKRNAYSYYRLGVLYEKLGNTAEAIKNLFYAVYYNPNLTDAQKEFEKLSTFIRIMNPRAETVFRAGEPITISWALTNPKVVEYYKVYLFQGNTEKYYLGTTKKPLFKTNLPDNIKPGTYIIRVYAFNEKLMYNLEQKWISFGEDLIKITK